MHEFFKAMGVLLFGCFVGCVCFGVFLLVVELFTSDPVVKAGVSGVVAGIGFSTIVGFSYCAD